MKLDFIAAVVIYAAAIIFGWFAAALFTPMALPALLPWWAVQPVIMLVGLGAGWFVWWVCSTPDIPN